jgi:hypothetical protein
MHVLALDVDAYLPTAAQAIPLGPAAPTMGTPFDFVTPTPIGSRIADSETETIKKWLLAHPRFQLHFTLTGSSWLHLR